MSDAIVKNLNFGKEARTNVFKGIDKLTQAVSSTLGASGKCVILEDNTGQPVITKDGVTVANSIILRDPVEQPTARIIHPVRIPYFTSRKYGCYAFKGSC